MQRTVLSWSANIFGREVFVEMTSLPVAHGILPCKHKVPDGSSVVLWRRWAIIISKPKKASRGIIDESRKVGEPV